MSPGYTGSVELDEPLRADIMRAELVRQQQEARGTINRGIVMIALVPLVILGAIGVAIGIGSVTAAVLALLGAGTYALIGSIGGLAMLASGAVEHRRVGKMLRDIDEPRQLPAARVVLR